MPRKASKKTLTKRWRRYNDLSGKRFGRLLVKERDSSEDYPRPYYKCVCDCGAEVVVCGTSLTRKSGYSRSCGCLSIDQRRLQEGEAARNSLYRAYKMSAKGRGLVFLLSKDEFLGLTSQDCFYCGGEPSSLHEKDRGYGDYIYNGIDRVDNNRGYELDNCVSCCGVCNLMKRDLSKEEFLWRIKNIYDEQILWEEE